MFFTSSSPSMTNTIVSSMTTPTSVTSASRRLFYTGADCVFFATAVLDPCSVIKLWKQYVRLTEHPAVHTFLPKMANQIHRELERRDEDGYRMEGNCVGESSMAGRGQLRQQVLSFAPFHSDTDSRKHFQGRQQAVYKNRETMKDSFLGLRELCSFSTPLMRKKWSYLKSNSHDVHVHAW